MHKISALVTGVCLAAAASACGSGSSDRAAPRPVATATVTVTATPSASGTRPSADQTLPPPVSAEVRHLGQLTSPSGNIQCALDVVLACVIQEATYEPLDRPRCPLDWNDHYFGVGQRSGFRGTCAGDTPFTGRPTVLPYGVSSIMGHRACLSEESGMTCWDTSTRHGFRIARASYTIF
jgi:hypothetical protein